MVPLRKLGDWNVVNFTEYRRTQIAEMRPYEAGESMDDISLSVEDMKRGSPRVGDMIARNPKNHADQWLVAAQYFADNFEQMFVPVVAAEEDETDAFDGTQAAEAASKIFDYADYNLTMFDACCDEIPQGAKDIYDAAKRLRDLLPCM